MIEAPHSTITIQNLTISQIIAGEGRPILMLHGWGANGDLLWPLANKLVPLGYQVFIPDLPGFGESVAPLTAWSVFDYADFVVAYVDHHQLEQVFLFGHSFGGRLGLILGAENPDRLIKMVLADAAGVRPRTSLTRQVRLNIYKGIRDGVKLVGLGGVSDKLRSWYNARYASTDFQATSGLMRESFVKIVNQDLLSYAQRVKPSTLLLWGEYDEDTPLWQGQLLEKTIPDAGLVVFPDAGHYSYLDKLADTIQVVNYFFRQPPQVNR